MRVGFFGGSFDPPHRGHVAIAQAAAERLALTRVLMAPVGLQPLKQGWTQAPYADRLAMVRLACAGDPRLIPSEIDAPRAGGRPNYTYETLLRLREALSPDDGPIFLIVGADSFRTLPQWWKAQELLELCNPVVAGRPGAPLDAIKDFLPAGVRADQVAASPELVQYRLHGGAAEGTDLYLLPDLQWEISATAIRAALASEGEEAARAEVAPAVAAYARLRALYTGGQKRRGFGGGHTGPGGPEEKHGDRDATRDDAADGADGGRGM